MGSEKSSPLPEGRADGRETDAEYAAAQGICGAPCHYGGRESTRRRSNADLGWQGHCNRLVAAEGGRCWQHLAAPVVGEREKP